MFKNLSERERGRGRTSPTVIPTWAQGFSKDETSRGCEGLSRCSRRDGVQRRAAKLSMNYLVIYLVCSSPEALHTNRTTQWTLRTWISEYRKRAKKGKKKTNKQTKKTAQVTVCDIVCTWFTRVWLFQSVVTHWTLTSGAVCRLTML